MKIFGNIDIQDNLKVDGNKYEGGLPLVNNDDSLVNFTDPEDGEVVITLHDYRLNIYNSSTSSWEKYLPYIVNKKSNHTLSSNESGLIFTDADNKFFKHISFQLPTIVLGLYYTFIKTKYTPGYRFKINCAEGNYIENINNITLECTSSGINSITLLAINTTEWFIWRKNGIWNFV